MSAHPASGDADRSPSPIKVGLRVARWFWTPRDCRIDRYLGFIALTMVTGLVVMVVIVGASR